MTNSVRFFDDGHRGDPIFVTCSGVAPSYRKCLLHIHPRARGSDIMHFSCEAAVIIWYSDIWVFNHVHCHPCHHVINVDERAQFLQHGVSVRSPRISRESLSTTHCRAPSWLPTLGVPAVKNVTSSRQKRCLNDKNEFLYAPHCLRSFHKTNHCLLLLLVCLDLPPQTT